MAKIHLRIGTPAPFAKHPPDEPQDVETTYRWDICRKMYWVPVVAQNLFTLQWQVLWLAWHFHYPLKFQAQLFRAFVWGLYWGAGLISLGLALWAWKALVGGGL